MSVSSRLRAELPTHYKVFFSVYFFFQACRMQTLQLFYVLVTPLMKGHWGPKHLERNANHKTPLLFISFCWTFPGLNLFLFHIEPPWVSNIFLSILAEPNRHAFCNRPNAQDISEALRPLLSSTGTVPRALMTIDMIHRAVTKGQGPGLPPLTMSMTAVYFHIGSKRKIEPKELPNHSVQGRLTAYTRDSPSPTLVPFFNPGIDWAGYVYYQVWSWLLIKDDNVWFVYSMLVSLDLKIPQHLDRFRFQHGLRFVILPFCPSFRSKSLAEFPVSEKCHFVVSP